MIKTNAGPSQVNMNFLDFEQPIAELEAKIDELRLIGHDPLLNISEEIERLSRHSDQLTSQIFSNLTPSQISKLSRHSRRPFTLDYVEKILDEVHELHGDRTFSDDAAIVCGIGKFDGIGVAFIGHQKGRGTKENLKRNFGMPKPEGYRKALRIMELAERHQLPVLTFIDTPGAFPGIEAEERSQSEAIARNLLVMSGLKTPIIASVIGEGGSGGALAIGVADRVLMMQYSTYAVISPEGCASILWKSADKAADAAAAMKITAPNLIEFGLIDCVIDEPLGGAHRDPDTAINSLKKAIAQELEVLLSINSDELIRSRRARIASIGRYQEKESR
jgi:acetyl-CoA carboxylase carboxyl transferase subunit alpha